MIFPPSPLSFDYKNASQLIFGPEPPHLLAQASKLINLLLAYQFASHIIPSALRHTTLGDNDGQGSQGCCSHGVAKNQTGLSNWTTDTKNLTLKKSRHQVSDSIKYSFFCNYIYIRLDFVYSFQPNQHITREQRSRSEIWVPFYEVRY